MRLAVMILIAFWCLAPLEAGNGTPSWDKAGAAIGTPLLDLAAKHAAKLSKKLYRKVKKK